MSSPIKPNLIRPDIAAKKPQQLSFASAHGTVLTQKFPDYRVHFFSYLSGKVAHILSREAIA